MFSAPAAALVAILALSGCQSSEEKAEAYYKSGLELLQKGDEDRAMIEFRNVFKENGFHKEARHTYADLLLKRGQASEAMGQYLRLIEQYPDTSDVRRNLAELSILAGNWPEAERHGTEALRLLPDDPTVKAIGILLDYRKATLADDPAGKEAAMTAARAYAAATGRQAETVQPGLSGGQQLIRQMLISDAVEKGDFATALPIIDAALQETPDDFNLNALRLNALAKSGDMAAIGLQLRQMVDKFPEQAELRGNLIRWYMAQKDTDGAEAFLRQQAGAVTDNIDGHVALIQFLQATRGRDAARAEATSLRDANAGSPNADLYGSLLAALDFEEGKRAEALQSIEAILAKAQPSDQTRKIRIMQARLLGADGDLVGARAQIETVLTEDASNVDALKMRAGWAIQADNPGAAIVDLRKALEFAPRDADIMTLMAQAHERDGAKDLAGERLAMAVEVSNRAAPESLRYASFLARDGRTEAALAVLTDARRANPADFGVLQALAQLYMSRSDWPNATEVATAIEQLPAPQAAASAKELRAAILVGQGKLDEGMSFLSSMAQSDGTEAGGTDGEQRRAVMMLVQTMLRNGKASEARGYVDEQLSNSPNDPFLKTLSAGVDIALGERERAEEKYRALLGENPANEAVIQILYGLLQSQQRSADAEAVLNTGLQAAPNSAALLGIQAGILERGGNIDGAIGIYEKLYTLDSSNVIVANNLASLITTFRNSPEDLERAWNVARRLRGTTVPAFADTYGWIAYRRGQYDEALPYLEAAARGLPEDAVVQAHLGMTYAALQRVDQARDYLERAIKAAGEGSTLAPIVDARAKLAELGG